MLTVKSLHMESRGSAGLLGIDPQGLVTVTSLDSLSVGSLAVSKNMAVSGSVQAVALSADSLRSSSESPTTRLLTSDSTGAVVFTTGVAVSPQGVLSAAGLQLTKELAGAVDATGLRLTGVDVVDGRISASRFSLPVQEKAVASSGEVLVKMNVCAPLSSPLPSPFFSYLTEIIALILVR